MAEALPWPCPLPSGDTASEWAITDGPPPAPARLLIIPALFDEANKLRRFTREVMRRLAGAGITTILPDLPGCHESLQPLAAQTPSLWRTAMASAAAHFAATHVLAIRGGALLAPPLPGWHYAPLAGASQLRQMLRARILSAREAGREETQDSLLAQGQQSGLTLAGYTLSPAFLREFGGLVPDPETVSTLPQTLLAAPGLWLRAEPGEDPAQADALAAILAIALREEAP